MNERAEAQSSESNTPCRGRLTSRVDACSTNRSLLSHPPVPLLTTRRSASRWHRPVRGIADDEAIRLIRSPIWCKVLSRIKGKVWNEFPYAGLGAKR